MLKHFQSFSTFSDRVKVQNEERKLQEKTTQQKEYADFFLKLLQQFDVTSPDELDDAKKKDFFDKVAKGWDKGTGMTAAGKTMVKESDMSKHPLATTGVTLEADDAATAKQNADDTPDSSATAKKNVDDTDD